MGASASLADSVAAGAHHGRAELVSAHARATAGFHRRSEPNWYLRVFDPGQHCAAREIVAALCARNEPLARKLLAKPGPIADFIASYAHWTMEILEQQRHYHYHVSTKQHALQNRVHAVNAGCSD